MTPDVPRSQADLPLRGRTALVTGVSRRRGIGYAVAVELASLGADVFIHHFSPHDADQPWGADDVDAVRAGVAGALRAGARMGDASADLQDPAAVERLIDGAAALTGRLDILVCNHARSGGDGSILDVTAESLDAFWGINTRSTLLLTRHFAHRHATGTDTPGTGGAGATGETGGTGGASGTVSSSGGPSSAGGAGGTGGTNDTVGTITGGARAPARPGDRVARAAGVDERGAGRVFWMTSGQGDGPMRGEVAYAASKAALAGVTATVAAELLERGIVLNTINPGPVSTGYLDPGTTDRSLDELEAWRRATPFGRWGQPTDPARLIGWLATDDGVWVVGQVLTTDGGLSLS